jgi:predicted dehydrogenase
MDLTGVATYADISALLSDSNVDVVDICLPPGAHAKAAIDAMTAGKHVICEKPIAMNLADADEMLRVSQSTGKMFIVVHVLPFFPSYAFVHASAQSGCFGKLLGGHFDRVISEPVWLKNFFDMDAIGGPLLDLHIHDAHFIRLLFGMPNAVQSVGRMRGNVPEYFSSQFIYDDKNTIVTSISGTIPQQGRPFMAKSEIHLERATIVIDSTGTTVLTEDGKVEKANIQEIDEVGIFTNELNEAVNAILSNKTSKILNSQLARDALLIALKEREAISQRTQIKFT